MNVKKPKGSVIWSHRFYRNYNNDFNLINIKCPILQYPPFPKWEFCCQGVTTCYHINKLKYILIYSTSLLCTDLL